MQEWDFYFTIPEGVQAVQQISYIHSYPRKMYGRYMEQIDETLAAIDEVYNKKSLLCFRTADFQFSLMFVLNIIQLRLQSQQLCYQQQLQCQLFQQQLLQLFQL